MVITALNFSMAKKAIQRQSSVQGEKLTATGNRTSVAALQRGKLYDLNNRGVLYVAPNIKDAKPRVDCHWKKPVRSDNSNAAATVMMAATTKSKTTATSNVSEAQGRMLWNPNWERFDNKVAASTIGIDRSSLLSGCILPKDRATKTTTILTKVKLVNSKVIVIDKAKESDKKPVDNNLLGEPLSKLHADSDLNAKPEPEPKTKTNKCQSNATRINVGKGKPTIRATVRDTKMVERMPKLKIVLNLPSLPKIEEPEKHISFSWKVLEDIEDIVTNDKNDKVAEYVNDMYDYLHSVESRQRLRKDHLRGQLEIQPIMRSELIDWIHNMHTQLFLSVETFLLAVTIIDFYLQAVKKTKHSELKLVGITALLIAAKYEEFLAPVISNYVYTTDYIYTSSEICRMEIHILMVLDFHLTRPLSIHFLRRFSKAPASEEIHESMCKYFLELATLKYYLPSYKPSQIAAASVFLTLHMLNGNVNEASGFNNNHWNKTLINYSRYCAEDLRPIAKRIAAAALNAPQSKFKSIYTKYQDEKFNKISMFPALYGPLMHSIVENKE